MLYLYLLEELKRLGQSICGLVLVKKPIKERTVSFVSQHIPSVFNMFMRHGVAVRDGYIHGYPL